MLHRQLDIESDRGAARLEGSLVGRLHDAGAAAGQDAVSGLDNQASERLRLPVVIFLGLGAGRADERLPVLPGVEAGAIARAFNRMADDVQAGEASRIAAAQSQARLDAERRFVHDLQRRFEAERRELAGALHDEMGQALTAIGYLADAVRELCEDWDGFEAALVRGYTDAQQALLKPQELEKNSEGPSATGS